MTRGNARELAIHLIYGRNFTGEEPETVVATRLNKDYYKQLSAENDNECNLVTGTRSFNVDGMLPFENMVADYIHETGNHVMYRVTPVFSGNNLLCDGVQIEAWSVEDEGEGVCFNVFVYNVQDGVEFDYATGENWQA